MYTNQYFARQPESQSNFSMARTSITLTTVYSCAQCFLSVLGSVGVILLFAGIPQLIYSPMVSAGNLITFVMGAVLIMTMVAGNTFLNYRFRRMDREGEREGTEEGSTSTEDVEDKPPSYDTILSLDGPPPEYASILPQKPPRYEEIAKETFAACGQDNPAPATHGTPAPATHGTPAPATHGTPAPHPHAGCPAPHNPKKLLTLRRFEAEVTGDERGAESEQNDKLDSVAESARLEDEEQEGGEQASQSLPGRDRHCVASGASQNSRFPGESET